MQTEPTNQDLPCAEKLVFDTKKDADASAVVVKYQHGTNVRSYKCRYCDLWHLASDYSDN